MDFYYADDSRQDKPTRPGMGVLIAIGGICVPEPKMRELASQIDKKCADYDFPPGEEFKWSPGRELWMHTNLTEMERKEFYTEILTIAESHEVKALMVVEDTAYKPAIVSNCPELDVASLFLERVSISLRTRGSEGLVTIDRPPGDRKSEDHYLADWLEVVRRGTQYVQPAQNVTDISVKASKFSRFLQLADVVTGCTVAFVSGEDRYSPPIFERVQRLLLNDSGRIGGVGLKIHPDAKYRNLYHWLLNDQSWKSNLSCPLPVFDYPYNSSPDTP